MSAPTTTTATPRIDEQPHADRPSRRAPAAPAWTGGRVPLTSALLDVAAHGTSFATPGHRGGRSCRSVEDR